MQAHHKKCRVLLVDDHPPYREELRSLLGRHEDIDVIGEAGDGKKAIEFIASCPPHVVLLDLNMPCMNGIEAATIIKASWPQITLIGLCLVQDRYTMEAFLKAGALAVISKSDALKELYPTIHRARPDLIPISTTG